MHIIVHEHMNSLDRDDWLGETREVHPVANRIAQGVLDREKQMGLYVGVDRDGVVRESPAVITADRCRDEIARTEKVSNALSISQGVVSLAASFDVPDSSNL